MKLKSEKTVKLVFMILFTVIVAYLVYVIATYYTQDRNAKAQLSFIADESNIISSVTVNYIMKENEGQIKLETNEKTSSIVPEAMIGNVFAVESIGKSISDAKLTVTYDDKCSDIDEQKIKLVRVDENGDTYEYQFGLDTDKNTVTAKFVGGGMWCLIQDSE